MSFPNVMEVLADWGEEITLKVVSQGIADFEVQETLVDDESFAGVVQPIQPRKLVVKPEGERDWKWLTLWTDKVLKMNAIVQDDAGRQYRVMSVSDWRGAGYLEYELVEQPITVPQ